MSFFVKAIHIQGRILAWQLGRHIRLEHATGVCPNFFLSLQFRVISSHYLIHYSNIPSKFPVPSAATSSTSLIDLLFSLEIDFPKVDLESVAPLALDSGRRANKKVVSSKKQKVVAGHPLSRFDHHISKMEGSNLERMTYGRNKGEIKRRYRMKQPCVAVSVLFNPNFFKSTEIIRPVLLLRCLPTPCLIKLVHHF